MLIDQLKQRCASEMGRWRHLAEAAVTKYGTAQLVVMCER